MSTLTFKPKTITKKFLAHLPERARDVIVHRYGLLEDAERKTLEAIGEAYGITRERVRQIENAALLQVKKSDAFKSEDATFGELRQVIGELGGIIAEEDLLTHLAKDKLTQNHINFFMVLHDAFTKHKEDDDFKHRWSVDSEITKKVHQSLKNLYESLSHDDLISEDDMIKRFLAHLTDVADEYKKEEILRRWLSLSKTIGKNKLGEWGVSQSSNIHARGIKDYAYLVIRRHGKPMHFKEVAKQINQLFGKKAHVATCHNELIKDKRFVLVGRGMYGLASWGHTGGVVRDVIRDVLKKEKRAMTKEEIIKAVLHERIVKENTIAVNLQNAEFFKKNKDGSFSLVK